MGKIFVKTQCFAKSGILELDLHQFMQLCVQTRLIFDNHRHKGWDAIPEVPKIQALPGWGGGGGWSDPCLDFCDGFVHMH